MSTSSGQYRCHGTLLLTSSDLPAKAMLMNMKRHNSKYGCPLCEVQSQPRNCGPMHRYWPASNTGQLRTHSSILQCAANVLENDISVSLSIKYLLALITCLIIGPTWNTRTIHPSHSSSLQFSWWNNCG